MDMGNTVRAYRRREGDGAGKKVKTKGKRRAAQLTRSNLLVDDELHVAICVVAEPRHRATRAMVEGVDAR